MNTSRPPLDPGPVLLSAEVIARRIGELGEEITRDYAGRAPLLVGVLKGAFMFMADLTRAIDLPVELDFMAVSSYGESTKSSGVVRIVKDLDLDLSDRDVILVEDIVDTGLTLSYLLGLLETRAPASLATVTLLDKTTRRIVDVDLDYRGFEVGDEFLLGYGLDWEGRYRNLSSLWAVLDLGEFQADPGAAMSEVFEGPTDRLNA